MITKEYNRNYKVKPYFKGQKTTAPCGHYYPDVLLNYDMFSKSAKMIERHCYCFKCKEEFILRLNTRDLAMQFIDIGNKKSIKQLRIIRNKELKRLQQLNQPKTEKENSE